MSDKELLELAAKAAGYEIVGDADSMVAQHKHGSDAFVIRNDKGGDSLWNPLTNDGDALNLEVKLSISIISPDNIESVRREIVRAAAEIGRNMK